MPLSDNQKTGIIGLVLSVSFSALGLFFVTVNEPIKLSMQEFSMDVAVALSIIDEDRVVIEDRETGEPIAVVKDFSYIWTILGASTGLGYFIALMASKVTKRTRVAA